MLSRPHFRAHEVVRVAQGIALGIVLLAAFFAGAYGAHVSAERAPLEQVDLMLLEPVRAEGLRVDTLFVGGYASGSFTEALRTLASEMSPQERQMVGGHLDKIFREVLREDGLGRAGRLRVAYERAIRPDSSTRSIRVLTAEAAVAGNLHRAYYYERDGRPGYYDPFGRELDESGWSGPLAGLRVTSRFGARRMHPVLRRVLPHTGVDLAAPVGTPVRATADGVVVVAGRRGGYGNMVEIRHPNGYSTRYAHLARLGPGIRPSSLVRQGDLVGLSGMTGLVTGPHLHYEVRRNGRPIDPMRIVAGGAPSQLSLDTGWPVERQRLSSLLARTPTVARRSGG